MNKLSRIKVADQGELKDKVATKRLPVQVQLYMICVVLPIFFSLGPVALNPLRIYGLVMVPYFILVLFRNKINVVDIFLFLHLIWSAISIAINNGFAVIEFSGSNNIEFLSGYLVARIYIRSEQDFFNMSRFLFKLILMLFPFALYETLTSVAIIPRVIASIPGLTSVLDANSTPRYGLERAQVVFGHPINYGLFCAIAFAPSYLVISNVFGAFRKYVRVSVVFISVVCSVSSGAILFFMIVLLLIAWEELIKFQKKWIILLAGSSFAYTIVEILSDRIGYIVLMSYLAFNTGNVYYRQILLEWGLKNIAANPIFGIGLNDWLKPIWMHSTSFDNFWILTAMRYGIPSFAFLVLGIVLAIWYIVRNDLVAGSLASKCRLSWCFTVTAIIFSIATVHVWGNAYSFVFFIVGSGVWLMSFSDKQLSPGESEIASFEPRRKARKSYGRLADNKRPAFSKGR